MTLITGTLLDDVLAGGITDDTIEGLDGNDALTGGAGLNTLLGGAGNDFIRSTSADTIDGGTGDDEALLDRFGTTVALVVDISASGSGTDIGDGTSLANIEYLYVFSGSGNDKLTGGKFTDYLFGSGGNDTIVGGDGNDKLDGQAGNDRILGGAGDDIIGDESGFFFGMGEGIDLIDGGAGSDHLILGRADSKVNLTIDISAGGGGFNIGDGSKISGIERAWINGGTGNDTMTGGALNDRFFGGNGDDTLNGGDGHDELQGGFGTNKLNGGVGEDYIAAEGTKDVIDGGADLDFLYINRQSKTAALKIDISAGGAGLDIGDGSTIANIEAMSAIGSAGNDTLIGGAFNDFLNGQGGTNTLAGGGGDDQITAGQNGLSVDIVNGGAGTDLLFLDRFSYTGNLTVNISAGGGNINIGDGSRISSVERIVFSGGNGSDDITGGGLDDEIGGWSGINKLNGGGGNDVITSIETAVDAIDGGAGTDRLNIDREFFAGSLTIDISAGGGGANIGDGSTIASIEIIDVAAGSGADTITGGAGDDKIDGRGGLDKLSGGGGNDTIASSIGDIIDGGTGEDLASVYRGFSSGDLKIDISAGGLGVDIGDGTKFSNIERLEFNAESGNHTVIGGTGGDKIRVADGKHFLDGGLGEDVVSFELSTTSTDLTVDISNGGGGLDIGNGTTLANFESLWIGYGGSGNDKFTGGALDDYLVGGSGDDILKGGQGTDTLYGTDGNDTVISLDGDGPDMLDGGGSKFEPDFDTLILNRSSQTKSLIIDLNADAFSFNLNIGDGTEFLNFERVELVSGSGHDFITGGIGDDIIDGGGANDTVFGSAGIDKLMGGAGSGDVLIYTGNLSYTPVDLVINLVSGKATTGLSNDTDTFSGFEVFHGSGGNDTLIGDASVNDLYGGDGDDIIRGGAGGDRLWGGSGLIDMLSYEGSSAVIIDFGLSTASGGDAAGDTMTGFEGVIGSSFADRLGGDAGNNRLDGGAGIDRMEGRAGDDTYVVDHASDATVETANSGIDLVLSRITHALRINIENLELTGAANINGTGNALANIITGNSGSNILNGLAGADSMSGKLGNDTYYIDDAGDTVTEAGSEGIDIVRSSLTHTLAANFEKLYLLTGAIDGTGNGLSNYIYGNAAANKLDGLLGADRLYGYAGDDTYTVDSAGDLVFETIAGAAGGVDTINASVNNTLSANVENLNLTGAANTNGTGNALANIVNGNSGNNFIDGKAGADTLTGGLGLDNFAFTTTLGTTNVDTVTDFTVSDDTIRLDNAVFASLALGYLSAGAFHIGSSAADAADRIIYDQAAGKLFYDADGTGGAAQVQFAILDTGLAMTNVDVYVF